LESRFSNPTRSKLRCPKRQQAARTPSLTLAPNPPNTARLPPPSQSRQNQQNPPTSQTAATNPTTAELTPASPREHAIHGEPPHLPLKPPSPPRPQAGAHFCSCSTHRLAYTVIE